MARWPSWLLPTVAAVTILLACALSSHTDLTLPPNEAATSVSITVDLDNGHSVAPTLYGIFFEEVRSGWCRCARAGCKPSCADACRRVAIGSARPIRRADAARS